MVAIHEAFGAHQPRLLGKVERLGHVVREAGKGFLAQDVLTRLERLDSPPSVQRSWQRNVNGVYAVRGEKALVRAMAFLEAVIGRKVLRPLTAPACHRCEVGDL
jgi:hypothetical protein